MAVIGSTRMERINGMGRIMPITTFGIVLCGLSLIGVPGTAGFVSKWYLVLAALQKGQWLLMFAIVLSSLLAVVYVWRVVEVAYFRAPRAGAVRQEMPLALAVPAWLMVAATVYFGLDTTFTVGTASEAAAMLLEQAGAATVPAPLAPGDT